MKDFKRSNRGAGRGGSRSSQRGSGRRFNDRDSGDRPQYQAVCSNCGKDCTVPFPPSGDRPVYCNDCFGDKNGYEKRPSGRFDHPAPSRTYRAPRRSSGPNYQDQLDTITHKLDAILKALQNIHQSQNPEPIEPDSADPEPVDPEVPTDDKS